MQSMSAGPLLSLTAFVAVFVSVLVQPEAVNSTRASPSLRPLRPAAPTSHRHCHQTRSHQNNPGSARVHGCVHRPVRDWTFAGQRSGRSTCYRMMGCDAACSAVTSPRQC